MTRRLGQGCHFAKFYASVCDNNFPSLVASLFSWRCLTASTFSSFYAVMNLRSPSVTVSTHTLAFNAVAFQSPVMPNARMSRCMKSAHYFSFPPRPLRTAPSRFPSTIHLGSRLPPIRMSAPTHKNLLVRKRCLNDLAPGYIKGTAARGHPMVRSLALSPDDANQDTVWCTVRSLA